MNRDPKPENLEPDAPAQALEAPAPKPAPQPLELVAHSWAWPTLADLIALAKRVPGADAPAITWITEPGGRVTGTLLAGANTYAIGAGPSDDSTVIARRSPQDRIVLALGIGIAHELERCPCASSEGPCPAGLRWLQRVEKQSRTSGAR